MTVGYTAPTDANATPLKDAAGNAAAGFSGQAVTNDTPAANREPTGLPEVSGTPQVGLVLTASVDGITDEDGLDNVTFAYQWLANDGTEDAEIAGAASDTYTVAPGDAGRTLKVRVTFTDDKGTAETLVSAATDAVTVPPLTATFENVPSEHDGSSIFTFRVRFSESPALSYTVLRDESFAVTGGSVDKARRVDGRNDLREIHVEPAGNGDVTLTLAGGRACGTTGAICTADNRVLSSTLTATVQGPPALNVADSRAEEGEDATLDFVVTLSRAAAGTVSVDYATADGSATAGEDYTATNGTLTFNAGETTETVSVPLLDDVVNDGGETFTLTLSNPSGAWIEDGEAVGTIENNDPLPTAWTARFGRSVAGHVLDAVEGRLEGGASESFLQLGGHRLGGHQAAADDGLDATERMALLMAGGDHGTDPAQSGLDATGRYITLKDLLLGSAFHLAADGGEGEATGPQLSAWGRVATSGFDGREGSLSLNGQVTTATLGVDGVWKRWLTGLALAYSEGDGSFTLSQLEAGGDLGSTLTSVHPYVGYSLSERVRVWGMAGWGSGEFSLSARRTYVTDLEMTMGAVGIRGTLLGGSRDTVIESMHSLESVLAAERPPDAGQTLQLAVHADALWVGMDTAAIEGMAATHADSSRVRLMLHGSRPISLGAGGALTPSLQIGVRHDGGDAETGSGLEGGFGLWYATEWGLSVEASVHGLLAHEDAEYREWGASAALRFAPGRDGRGLSASVMPAWGTRSVGGGSLWGQAEGGLVPVDGAGTAGVAGSLHAELAYGLAALRGRGLLTPYARVAVSESSAQDWQLGARLAVGGAVRPEPGGQPPPVRRRARSAWPGAAGRAALVGTRRAP